MRRFEYMRTGPRSRQYMDSYGKEGWELVAAYLDGNGLEVLIWKRELR